MVANLDQRMVASTEPSWGFLLVDLSEKWWEWLWVALMVLKVVALMV
jgi:hypothetical protein